MLLVKKFSRVQEDRAKDTKFITSLHQIIVLLNENENENENL